MKLQETYDEYLRRLTGPAMEYAKRHIAEGPDAIRAFATSGPGRGSSRVIALLDAAMDQHVAMGHAESHSHMVTQLEKFSPILDAVADVLERGVLKRTKDSGYDRDSIIVDAWLRACYRAGGNRAYELSPGIASRFMQTETRGLTLESFQLPFPSFYIGVPLGHGPKGANAVSDFTVTGIFVNELRPADGAPAGARLIQFAAVADTLGQPAQPGELGSTLRGLCGFWTVQLLPTDEVSVERITKPLQGNTKAAFAADVMRVAINTVTYVTWNEFRVARVLANPEAEALRQRRDRAPLGKRRDELSAKLRAMDRRERIYIGAGVPLLEAPTGEPRGPLQVRTLVTGHWRNQPHGPGRSQRRMQWIEPFFRGPDAAPETQPVRVVRG